MRRFGRLLALTGFALLVFVAAPRAVADDPAAGSDDSPEAEYLDALGKARKIEASLIKTVRKVRTYSVSVRNLRRIPKNAEELRLVAVGSGVLVTYKSKLWIITNVHVIEGADGLEIVTHDGEIHVVDVHDTIPQYDIALLAFKEKPKGYRGVTIRPAVSKSASNLREGTWVIATGNPFFLALDGRSVTTLGVVSGTERFLGGKFQYVDAIQHDTEVNPGNSGGPLWNLKGELVGINGKIAMTQMAGGGPSNTGASFSLPVHQIDEFMPLLVRDADAQSAFLGIETETFADDRGRPKGATITKIDPRSPVSGAREKNRPKDGDVIYGITIDGSPKNIYTASDLRNVLSVTLAGASVTLKWRRGRKNMSWKGELGGR